MEYVGCLKALEAPILVESSCLTENWGLNWAKICPKTFFLSFSESFKMLIINSSIKGAKSVFFRLHQICTRPKRKKLQILTKGQNNRSLHPQLLLGSPEKGKNPKSTELCFASFLAFI